LVTWYYLQGCGSNRKRDNINYKFYNLDFTKYRKVQKKRNKILVYTK